jgi:hypothetical protein
MKQASKTYINSIKPNKKGLLVLFALVVFLPVTTALLFEANNSVAPFSLLKSLLSGFSMLVTFTICYHLIYFVLKYFFVKFILKQIKKQS